MRSTYEIDPAHSSVQFSVRHLMIANVRGSFTGVKGTIGHDPDNPAATTIEAEIDASTVNTHDATRDAQLTTPDFLDVPHYPKITFRSTKVQSDKGGHLQITGDLTIHGTTKPVALTVGEVSPEGKDSRGNLRIRASAKTKIKRSEFGLSWNTLLEAGGFMVGDDVKLDFEVELIKAQSAAA